MASVVKSGDKIVKDAVHDYIYIRRKHIQSFIDTPNFQRLKRLEQTNMRPLYPSAHHDRFVHSLGVYHLGRMAYRCIQENSEEYLKEHEGIAYFESVKNAFEIACLLHDVGHAPFSHTFEYDFYSDTPSLNDILAGEVEGIKHKTRKGEYNGFVEDYKSIGPGSDPKPHEKVGAILVLTEYFSIIDKEYRTDPYLVARMILGLKYKEESSTQIYNCFIGLLNGVNIDVDKLDYIVRDQWATGRNTRNIDYERLIGSMCIVKDDNEVFTVCFHKKAITEVIAVVEAKNMIVSKILSHHLLRYDTHVLKQAIKDVAKKIDPESSDESIGRIISLKAIQKDSHVELGTYRFKLLTDDDLIHILKTYMDDCDSAKEWFNRNYELKAVWKTIADFNHFFKSLGPEERLELHTYKDDIVKKCLASVGLNKCYHIEANVNDEYAPLEAPGDIKILIKDKIETLGILMHKSNQEFTEAPLDGDKDKVRLKQSFFLLYVDKKVSEKDSTKRDELISAIIAETQNRCLEKKVSAPISNN